MREIDDLRGVIIEMRDSTEKAIKDFDAWTDRWIPYALAFVIGYFTGCIVQVLR
jgi:hypothetical protein